MSGLRVAVVGAGRMGAQHAAAIRANGDHVAAVVDADLETASALAGRVGAEPSAGIIDIDSDRLDACVVATPTADHLRTTRQLLDRGLAVLVEKPHRTPADPPWQDRAGDPPCWVGMTTRFQRGMAAARKSIGDGDLGEIRWWSDRIWYRLGSDSLSPWYFDRAVSGGGVLITNGVHAIDRVRWMLGDVQFRGGVVGSVFPTHDVDDGAALWGSAAAARVEISLLWATGPVPSSELVVVGTDGTAVVRPGDRWVIDGRDGVVEGEDGQPSEPFERQWAAFAGAMESPVDDAPTPAALEPTLTAIEDFYRTEDPCS